MKADSEKDFVRLGNNIDIGFPHKDVTDESGFFRSFKTFDGK